MNEERRRRIPFVRLAGGLAVRYRQSDLDRMIKAGSVPALRQLRNADDGSER